MFPNYNQDKTITERNLMNILNRTLPPFYQAKTNNLQLKWGVSFMMGECFTICFPKVNGYTYFTKYMKRMEKWSSK